VADAGSLTQTVIGQLRDHIVQGVLDRDVIVAVTSATLKRFDVAAYTMYRAYHPVAR
jgi:hypothetical protein